MVICIEMEELTTAVNELPTDVVLKDYTKECYHIELELHLCEV